MKVGTLLAHLGKGGSLQAPVKIKHRGYEAGVDYVYFRKDGTFVIKMKGGQ